MMTDFDLIWTDEELQEAKKEAYEQGRADQLKEDSGYFVVSNDEVTVNKIRTKILDEIEVQLTLLKNGNCHPNCACSDNQEECPYLQAIHDMEFYLDEIRSIK